MGTTDTEPAGRIAADGGHDASETGRGGENVLVLASSTDGGVDDYCASRLSSPPGTVSPNALLVSLDDTPDRRVDAVVRTGPERPSNVGVVCCDETRSAATGRSAGGPDRGLGPWTATVPSPGDLTGFGVRIDEALSAWGDDAEPVELCFHSLTTLCQYVDEREAFRFCHAVTHHVSSVGASSHFHLDPTAVDDRTVTVLSALFDRIEDRT